MKCIAKTDIQYRPHPIKCIKQDCVMWTGSACAIVVYKLNKISANQSLDLSGFMRQVS